jgi:hypothetical protein
MLDYIVHFVERVGHWGYFVIFLVVMTDENDSDEILTQGK